MCYNLANEMRSFVTWLVILAAGAALGRAQTCVVAPNRSIIGTFVDSDGEVYVFRPGSGNAITLTTSNTGSEVLVHTFVSSDGNTFNYNVTFSYLDGSGITGKGTLSFTLSADGNTAAGKDQGVDSQGVPYGSTFTITRTSGTATLVPATLNLMGAPGGQPVTDNTSLKLYNCGLGTANWTATATGAFLAVGPPTTGSLPPGASTTLTLTATPGATSSSATGTITVSSPTGDFAPATTGVTFTVGTGLPQISLSNPSPPLNTNLETLTPFNFAVDVAFTAAPANLTLELVSGAGAPLDSPKTFTATQGGTVHLSAGFTIPDGTDVAVLRVLFQAGSAASITMDAGSYLVFPQPKLIVASAKELWSGSLSFLGVAFSLTGGSPDRNEVDLTIGDGTLTRNPKVSVDGPGFYFALAQGLTIPTTSQLAIHGVLKGTTLLEDVLAADWNITVDPPPQITGIMVEGDDNIPKDATKPNVIVANKDQTLTVETSYTGLTTGTYLVASTSVITGSFPVTNTRFSDFTIHFTSAQALIVSLINSAGQKVSLGSAVQTPEYVDQPVFGVGGNTLTFTLIPYAGQANDIVNINITADFPGTISPNPVVCKGLGNVADCGTVTLPAPLPAKGHVTAVATIQHPDGTPGASNTYGQDLPVLAPLKAGQTVAAGPVTLTPASGAGNVTLQNSASDLGVIVSGSSPQALAAANLAKPAAPNARSRAYETLASGMGTPVAPGSLAFLNGTVNFSPSIPNNGTFTAQLVYQYSSAVLPDDPGFNPANLELVSYDPATQQLLTYPSTVNTAAQTVTATVSGLAPYYALAVPASTLGSALNLPLDPQNEAAAATVALLNAGTVLVDSSLIARGPDGTALAPNPTTGPILPGQQIAGSFASLGAANAGAGWVQAYADAGTVGVALLSDPSGFEGLALSGSSIAVVISGMQLASGQFTELDVANATPFQNYVTLELHDLTGAMQGQSQIVLAPKGSFSSTLEAEFAKAASPLQGYVVVRGTERLTASALVRTGTALAAINGQPLSLGAAGSTTLYAPHFLAGGGFASRLDIANPTALDAHVMIQGNKDDGTLFATAISVTIKAGTAYSSDIGTLLGLNPNTGTAGSLTVTSDVSGLVGDVALADTATSTFHSAAIALAAPLGSAVIPYVYNTSDSPMTLYVLNTGTANATVQVGVLAANGSTVGQTTLSIPAGGRSAQPLSALVAASAGQIGGAIQINSNQPVAAVAMILPVAPTADFAAIPAAPSSLGASSHPSFFTGEVSLGSGVYYLQFADGNLFGYYDYVASSIFYHYDMGFEFFVPGSGADTYLYDFTSSHWWYTSSTLFPYLYDFTLNAWIYYFPDTKNPGHYTTNPRYFSNLTTGKVFTM